MAGDGAIPVLNWVVYFDGACEPSNPGGWMGMGSVIYCGPKQVYSYSAIVAESAGNSNNVAEYLALEMGLDWLLDHGHRKEPVLVRGDANLVINQCAGKWQIKKGLYADDARRVIGKAGKFENIRWQWIQRENNSLADKLSKQILADNGISPC